MEQFVPLLIQVAAGATGGFLVHKVLPEISLKHWIHSTLGALGGIAGGGILRFLEITSQTKVDLAVVVSSIAGGCVGGILLTVLVLYLKHSLKE